MEWVGKMKTQEGAVASSEMLDAVERSELAPINSLIQHKYPNSVRAVFRVK